MIKALTQEMIRVTAKGGSTIIITNGTPEKRLTDLNDFMLEKGYQVDVKYEEIDLSKLSQMINIMRSKLGDKPLSAAIKDP